MEYKPPGWKIKINLKIRDLDLSFENIGGDDSEMWNHYIVELATVNILISFSMIF